MATQNEVLLTRPGKEATLYNKHQAKSHGRHRATTAYLRKADHRAKGQRQEKERSNLEQMSGFFSEYWFD